MPRPPKIHCWLLPAATALILSPLAWTTTVAPRDLRSLSQNADEILIGTAGASTSRWINGKIFTDTAVVPSQMIAGETAETIVLTHLGGVVHEPYPLALVVPQMPHFETGERVLLFIHKGPRSRQVLGLSQGKLTVVEGSDGQARVFSSGDVPSGSAVPAVSGRPLNEVIAEIQGYRADCNAGEENAR